jgi:hypothetical protein
MFTYLIILLCIICIPLIILLVICPYYIVMIGNINKYFQMINLLILLTALFLLYDVLSFNNVIFNINNVQYYVYSWWFLCVVFTINLKISLKENI